MPSRAARSRRHRAEGAEAQSRRTLTRLRRSSPMHSSSCRSSAQPRAASPLTWRVLSGPRWNERRRADSRGFGARVFRLSATRHSNRACTRSLVHRADEKPTERPPAQLDTGTAPIATPALLRIPAPPSRRSSSDSAAGEIEHRRMRGLLAAAMLLLVGSAVGLLLARSNGNSNAAPTAPSVEKPATGAAGGTPIKNSR